MDLQYLKRKTEEVNNILEREFGVPERPENEDPLDVLIHTILSQNTNDANSGRAYDNLRERFPSWEDVLSADIEEIADAIRVGGLSKQKSMRIKNLLKWIKDTYGKLNIDFVCDMEPSEVIEIFTKLDGIGLKTVNVMLVFACGRDVFPVDTHILRICKRLSLIPANASSEKAHEIMGQLFPRGKAFSLHINMIKFGRSICHAQRPKCRECPLIEHCTAWQEFVSYQV